MPAIAPRMKATLNMGQERYRGCILLPRVLFAHGAEGTFHRELTVVALEDLLGSYYGGRRVRNRRGGDGGVVVVVVVVLMLLLLLLCYYFYYIIYYYIIYFLLKNNSPNTKKYLICWEREHNCVYVRATMRSKLLLWI